MAVLAAPALGLYSPPDLIKVPLTKLLVNLKQQVDADPDNADLKHHLARAHAMAYAKKLAENALVETDKKNQLWFGFEPKQVPFASKQKKTNDKSKKESALAHLASAIKYYSAATKMKPADGTIQIGYGWCLQQSGKKKEAITAYRLALRQFWKQDQKKKFILGTLASDEAIGYLMPLLDKKKDAAEIADLNEKLTKTRSMGRAMTPIAVAIEPGAQLENILASNAVRFDADGSGRLDHWSWIKPNAGWLVYDRQGNGKIDSAIQMFGNRTFMLFLNDGYEAMKLLDANADNRLSGIELQGLALWIDRNGDAVSNPGEVQSLDKFEIESLEIRSRLHSTGIRYAPSGVRYFGGETNATYDVLLHRQNETPFVVKR